LIQFDYDLFIGREIFEDGYENFVTLDLQSMGSVSYSSLEQAFEDYCRGLKEGKRILLFQSPGQIGAQLKERSFVFQLLNSTLRKTLKAGISAIVIDQKQEKETYILKERKFKPFKPEQLAFLLQRIHQFSIGYFPIQTATISS